MNRLYRLKTDSREILGLVSPGELPDVVINFYRESAVRGADAVFLDGGILLAKRDGVQLTLEIMQTHPSIPSKLLLDALTEVMEKTFK